MELQGDLENLTRDNTALFAISYDSVEVLAEFAAKHGITFPLLSDEGSETLRALGLYNNHLAEQAAYYGRAPQPHQFGVAYPGVFLLDERGVIVAKEFEQGYRVRPTSKVLAEKVLGWKPTPAVSSSFQSPDVTITAWLSDPTYRPYQRLLLHVDLQLGPGLHIYGPRVPAGMVPLAIRIDPFEGLEVDPVELPPSHPLRVEGTDDELPVYEGTTSALVPLSIIPAQPEARLAIRVDYQVCSEYACFPPASADLELTVRGVELVRD